MGNALMKLGKSAEAGVAFREARSDEANPDPTKALLNLGVCFMALEPPGRRRGLLRERAAVRHAARHAQQAAREPGAGLRGLRPDAEGGARLRARPSPTRRTSCPIRPASTTSAPSAPWPRERPSSHAGHPRAQLADMSGLDVAADGTAVYDEGAYEAATSRRTPYLRRGHLRADPASSGYVGARSDRPVLHGHRRGARAVVARLGQAGSQAPQRGSEDPGLRHVIVLAARGRRVRSTRRATATRRRRR